MVSIRQSRVLGACRAGLVAAILSGIAPGALAADDAPAAAPTELDLAFEAAGVVAQRGPGEVKLGAQASLKLPENYFYVPPKESGRLMQAMGNRIGEGLLGMVFPGGSLEENWFVVIRFDGSGYIKDDDAKEWNAEELLQSLKDGTEEANKDRVARGIKAIEVVGWVEKPRYEAATHQLVWSVASKEKGQANAADRGINYNTYTLGREGYISMNLVTDLNLIGRYQGAAKTLLAGLSFSDGKRYADFNASTDQVAAYGLAALVGGVAAKKLGLFAALAVVLAKFWKLIAVAVFVLGAGVAKYFKRRKANTPTA